EVLFCNLEQLWHASPLPVFHLARKKVTSSVVLHVPAIALHSGRMRCGAQMLCKAMLTDKTPKARLPTFRFSPASFGSLWGFVAKPVTKASGVGVGAATQ